MMSDHQRNLCKMLAFLLQYPGAAWSGELADVEEVIRSMEKGQERLTVETFLAYAGSAPAIERQEAYTAAFDLAPETSLNLTYHLLGDNEDRGTALAGLLAIYRVAGYDPTGGELPDFLPLMLEFLAIITEPKKAGLFWSCLGAVAPLATRLRESGHPYAGLLELTADLVQPRIEEHAHIIKEEA